MSEETELINTIPQFEWLTTVNDMNKMMYDKVLTFGPGVPEFIVTKYRGTDGKEYIEMQEPPDWDFYWDHGVSSRKVEG